MNKQILLCSMAAFPLWLNAAPQFPSNQTQFEDALSLPVPILQTMKLDSMGYECVTSDAPHAPVLFDFDSDALKLDFHPILAELVKALQNRLADADFTIEGHTDNVGMEEYNMALSLRRAQAVRQYLLKHGIAARRLSVTGKGEQNPLADNVTAQGRMDNRRVEIVRVSGVCK